MRLLQPLNFGKCLIALVQKLIALAKGNIALAHELVALAKGNIALAQVFVALIKRSVEFAQILLVVCHGFPQSHLSPREFLPQSKAEHAHPPLLSVAATLSISFAASSAVASLPALATLSITARISSEIISTSAASGTMLWIRCSSAGHINFRPTNCGSYGKCSRCLAVGRPSARRFCSILVE
jgi:hypothetical protein